MGEWRGVTEKKKKNKEAETERKRRERSKGKQKERRKFWRRTETENIRKKKENRGEDKNSNHPFSPQTTPSPLSRHQQHRERLPAEPEREKRNRTEPREIKLGEK
jgi:hypothetical protein